MSCYILLFTESPYTCFCLERENLFKRRSKEQCHKDFTVLGQFCGKIITLRLKSGTQCFCEATTKISNESYQRWLTIANFLRIFGTCSIKNGKNWQIFSSFSPFPSMPSIATGDKKQFHYIQIAFNNS